MSYTETELRDLHRSMISANRGYWDGVNARSLKRPPHTEWPEGPHFDADYESGYWAGWNNLGIPYVSGDFAIFDDYEDAA